MPARVAIVIPHWNRAELLAETLASLGAQTYPIDRVIVMDNGSTDHSAAVATRAGAETIALGKNVGFAAAVNRGIEAARGSDYVGILNNDVTLREDWLARLIGALESGEPWFATGKLLDAEHRDRMEGSFDALCRGGCAWRCGHGRPDSPLWNQARAISFAPLTAAVFRAGVFERVGLLDESFESYLEDVDWGLRAASAGLSGRYIPEAVAYHKGSATLGRWHPETVRRMARNQLLLVAKHYPENWVLRYGWSIFIAQTLWGLVALRHGALLSYLAGKVEGMRYFHQTRVRQTRENPSARIPAGIAAILERSEREIYDIQKLTGFDLYWRLYFALT
ncbi:MAG TPA: glycosyltransferase family 2 protein [Bryobacteraceae bacterium]|nr:glycosyltransferase family 2 protein [Bryobacteraceae bacterium]